MSVKPCSCTLEIKGTHDPNAPRLALFTDAEVAEMPCDKQKLARDMNTTWRSSLCRHESGHTVAAACFGRSTDIVTVDINYPHAKLSIIDDKGHSLLAFIAESIGGDVADAVLAGRLWRPDWPLLETYISRARANMRGSCDRCFESFALMRYWLELSDVKLTTAWRQAFEIAFALICHDEIRGCAAALAQELEERSTLYRAEIEQVFARYRLMQASREALGSLDTRCFSSWTEDLRGCA